MNMTLMVLLIEVGVALLGIVAVIVFFSWKKKKMQTAGFELLLNNIKEIKDERKAQLIQFLMDSHALPEEEATESGEYMIEAEKQFLAQFVKQQLEQKPMTDFYQNLCELLDQYLYFIPKAKTKAMPKTVLKKQPVFEQATEINESVLDDLDVIEPVTDVTEEPGWGEAFAESGDTVDESTKEAYESGLKNSD